MNQDQKLYGSICLSDIDTRLIREGKNGKKYLSVEIYARHTPSQFGTTHTIKQYIPKALADECKDAKPFIGDLTIQDIKPAVVEPTATQAAPGVVVSGGPLSPEEAAIVQAAVEQASNDLLF